MNLFNISKISIFALVLFSVLAYQNCSRTAYENLEPSQSKSAASLGSCAGGTVSCQSNDGIGYGAQTCDNVSSGAVYGRCILTSCASGYIVSSGICIPSNQPHLTIKAYGAGLPAEGVTEFTTVPSQKYRIVVSGSSDVMMAGLRSSDLKKISGECSGVESYSPWTLDGDVIAIGENEWEYSGSQVNVLGGCQWNGCITSANGIRGCLHVTAGKVSSTQVTTTTTPSSPSPTTTTQASYQSPISCESGAESFVPFVTLQIPQVSSSCANGIEMNNLVERVYEMDVSSSGAFAREGWVDYATYDVSDSLAIYSVNSSGQRKTLFSKCNISTWTNPFTQLVRPPDATIRQQSVAIPSDAVKIIFDFSKTRSPFYVRMQGLCDFNRNALRELMAPVNPVYPGLAKKYPEGQAILETQGALSGKPRDK